MSNYIWNTILFPIFGGHKKAKLVKWYQCSQNPAIAMKMPHDFPATNIVSAVIKVCRPWPCLQIITQGDLNMECFNTSKYPKLTVFSILHFLLNITKKFFSVHTLRGWNYTALELHCNSKSVKPPWKQSVWLEGKWNREQVVGEEIKKNPY